MVAAPGWAGAWLSGLPCVGIRPGRPHSAGSVVPTSTARSPWGRAEKGGWRDRGFHSRRAGRACDPSPGPPCRSAHLLFEEGAGLGPSRASTASAPSERCGRDGPLPAPRTLRVRAIHLVGGACARGQVLHGCTWHRPRLMQRLHAEHACTMHSCKTRLRSQARSGPVRAHLRSSQRADGAQAVEPLDGARHAYSSQTNKAAAAGWAGAGLAVRCRRGGHVRVGWQAPGARQLSSTGAIFGARPPNHAVQAQVQPRM